MASYHLSAKIGVKGKAAAHASYISREGKYQGRERYEDLEATGHGNMPKWAEQNPAHFWNAADENERANGSAYREIEVALPRELTPEQRLGLVEDFVRQELGDQHVYQWAIHTPKAALDGGEQPHAHIMYSERRLDGIERDPDQFFKRYNSKAPEKGGAQKASGGRARGELKQELLELRERWADVQNRHLHLHGHDVRVDHRSLKEQGIERDPEKHLGGSGVRALAQQDIAALLERRVAEGQHERAQLEVSSLIDLSGDLAAAKAEKINQEKERDGIRAKAFERIDAACRATVRGSAAAGRASAFVESDIRRIGEEYRAVEAANRGVGKAIAERGRNRDVGKALETIGFVIERAYRTIARAVPVAIHAAEARQKAVEAAQAAQARQRAMEARQKAVQAAEARQQAVEAAQARQRAMEARQKAIEAAQAAEARQQAEKAAVSSPAALLEQLKAKLQAMAGRVVDLRDAAFSQVSGTVIAANERWAAMHIGRETQLLDRQTWPVEEGRSYVLRDGAAGKTMQPQRVEDRTVATLEYVYGKQMGEQAKQWAARDQGVSRGPQIGR